MKKNTIEQLNKRKSLASKLTALSFSGYKIYENGARLQLIICKCVCGNNREISVKSFLAKARSCGCLNRGALSKHGMSNGEHPLYNIWLGMKKRCNVPTNKYYKYYGGRGVKVCDEWQNDFLNFYKWAIKNGYKKGLQLDKDIKAKQSGIPPLLYSPDRCQFVTPQMNCRYRRNSIFITYDNKTMCIKEWSEYLHIPIGTIMDRYLKGWNVDKILSKNRFYSNINQYTKNKISNHIN